MFYINLNCSKRNGRNSRTHVASCSLNWLRYIVTFCDWMRNYTTIRKLYETIRMQLCQQSCQLMRTTRAEVQPEWNARAQPFCKWVQIQMRQFCEEYLHEVLPNQIETYLVKTWSTRSAPRKGVLCNNAMLVTARLALWHAKPDRRDSILKCTASHCQRSTQTLFISHLLQFQRANIKNH